MIHNNFWAQFSSKTILEIVDGALKYFLLNGEQTNSCRKTKDIKVRKG